MENEDRDGMVERIKKLFALADNNPNQNEAIAAALKAQRLMADYDVEEWELHGSDEQPIAEVEAEPTRRRWRWHLADVIASNFRCKSYQQKRRSKDCFAKDVDDVPYYKFKEKEKVMVFYGYQCDAQAAALTFGYLFRTGDRLARRYADGMRKEHGWADGAYNMFVAGFVEGVRIELEKQSQALMLVIPAAVAESYETMAADWGCCDSRLHLDGAFADSEAREAGREAGREAVRSRRMDKGDSGSLLSASVAEGSGRCTVHSAVLSDGRVVMVDVEVVVGGAIPAFCIVGMPDTVITEIRGQIRAAIQACGFFMPDERLTANLSFNGSRREKSWSGFELPIAAALLAATGQIDPCSLDGSLITGGLLQCGTVQPMPGAAAFGTFAREQGLTLMCAPCEELVDADGAEQRFVNSIADLRKR